MADQHVIDPHAPVHRFLAIQCPHPPAFAADERVRHRHRKLIVASRIGVSAAGNDPVRTFTELRGGLRQFSSCFHRLPVHALRCLPQYSPLTSTVHGAVTYGCKMSSHTYELTVCMHN